MVGRPAFRVKRPYDHPVRADSDRRAGFVIGIRIAALRGADQHVSDAWTGVGSWSRGVRAVSNVVERVLSQDDGSNGDQRGRALYREQAKELLEGLRAA